MPLFQQIKQFGIYNYILEDPDPKYKRIFIENLEYNTAKLIPGKNFFQFQSNLNIVSSPTTMSADFREFAPCDTDGKFGSSWSDTRTAWYGGIGKTDPWLLCLNYNYNPRRIFYDNETDAVYFNYYRDLSTTDIRSDWWHGKSLTDTNIYNGTTQSYLMTPLYKWRSPKENKDGNALTLVCFNHDNTATNIARFTFTPGALSTYTNILSSTIPFFIDTDDLGTGYFINYNVTSHNYDIYQINADVDIATPGSIIKTVAGQGLSSVCYQFPSNLKHDSAIRKVFYSGHWNASSILAPKRIIWNKNTNEFYEANCTMLYPSSNTYSNHAAVPTSSNYSADASNNWWMKPHVFQKSGNNYITFCTTEKCIHGFPTERWNASQLQRNWITFSIGTGDNDYILSFHSTYSWPTAIEMPRAWAPISNSGDKLIVMQTGKTIALEFDTTLGWRLRSTQSIDARSYAIDSTGRIFLITRGQASATQTATAADVFRGTGLNEIFIFDPSTSVRNVNIGVANNIPKFNATTGDPVLSYLNFSTNNKKILSGFGAVDRFNPHTSSPFSNNYSLFLQSASSDRLTSSNSDDFNFRTGDFTIEFWLRSDTAWTSQTSGAGIVGQKVSDASLGWQIFRNATFSDKLTFRFAGTIEAVSSGAVVNTTWQHWAVVRNGGVITIYRDGVSSNTLTSSADIYDFTGQFSVGFNQVATAYYNGYISNMRICKGFAVYTSNFTPSTFPLQQTTGTVFLGFNSNKVEDNRQYVSGSFRLSSLSNDLKFNHELANLRNDIIVITNTSSPVNVPISILGSGPLYIKTSGTVGPTWNTPSGSLFTYDVYETQPISALIDAYGDEPLTYTFNSGTLPTGISFNALLRTVAGILPYENQISNTYTFTIKVTDVNGYFNIRQFSINNKKEQINWFQPPSNNYTIDVLSNSNFSYTLNAYSTLVSDQITYTLAGNLPNGISISGNTISGNTPDTTTVSLIITARSATTTTSNTSNIYVNLSASQAFGGNTTITTINGINYKTHTFTSSNTLIVASNSPKTANVLVIAGGGGGALGGGGAGGYRETTIDFANVSNNISIVIGAGGSANQIGSNSSITYYNPSLVEFRATRGGRGANDVSPGNVGVSGGSGGGAMRRYSGTSSGGAGNLGGYSPVEGYSGGQASSGRAIGEAVYAAGGGGGGASASGSNGTGSFPSSIGGKGGDGKTWIDDVIRGGGGGGGIQANGQGTVGLGGSGGGGKGGIAANTSTAGQQSTGGGGGGGGNAGQAGGSGIVIIRYPL